MAAAFFAELQDRAVFPVMVFLRCAWLMCGAQRFMEGDHGSAGMVKAAHRLARFVCSRLAPSGWREGHARAAQGRDATSALEALMLSDVFASGLIPWLSPVELSRLALSCRAGAQVTSDAAVWWSVCVLRYRFGHALRHRVEVAAHAGWRAEENEEHAAASPEALCRAWRNIAAALWWYVAALCAHACA